MCQLDSLMAGIVSSSDLLASAAASAMGTTTAAEGAAFQRKKLAMVETITSLGDVAIRDTGESQ